MGAISANVSTVQLVTGPMMTARHGGAPDPPVLRGYSRLCAEEAPQADEGCDFRFTLPLRWP